MVLSNKYLEFNVRFGFKIILLLENAERYGFSIDLQELIQDSYDEWTDAYYAYINPVTHNDGTISDLSTMYDKCFLFIASIKKLVTSNTLIELTGTEEMILEINSNTKKVGKIPVTNFAPSLACISNSHLLIRLFAFDPHYPNKKQKPFGAGSIGFKIAYTNEGEPPPHLKDYNIQIAEKKSIFEMSVGIDMIGKMLYIIAYYLSPTNEVGADSIPCCIKIN